MELDIAIPLLTFLAGALIGHWLTLWREHRKEFNEVADRVRAVLQNELPEASCMCPAPTKFDLDLMRQMTPWWRRRPLQRAVDRHAAAKKDYSQDEYGQTRQNNVHEVREAITHLIKFTRRR